MEEVVPNYFEQ